MRHGGIAALSVVGLLIAACGQAEPSDWAVELCSQQPIRQSEVEDCARDYDRMVDEETSGRQTISGDDLEPGIRRWALDQGGTLDAVDCPTDRLASGDSITCSLRVEGSSRDFEFEVELDDAGRVTKLVAK